jgi:hypothetical protein
VSCHPRRVIETERAEQLLAATGGYFPYPTDPTAITIEEMALAGLARCRRLLTGLVEVHDSPDLGGLFARSLYETWVVAVYLLVGGDDAYERLDLNDRLAIYKFSKRLVEFVDQDTNQRSPGELLRNAERVVAIGKPQGGELHFNDLVLKVGRLLTEQGDPNSGFLERGYVSLFMPESYTTVHGGIGALKQHVLDAGEPGDVIGAGPWEHANHALRLEMCTPMVAVLARSVALRLGLDHQGPEDVLIEMLDDWPLPTDS